MNKTASATLPTYTVIPSRRWQRDDGCTASVYGACPWTSSDEEPRWAIVTTGWTVRNNRANTVGVGRPPWATQEEAQAFADKHNGTTP